MICLGGAQLRVLMSERVLSLIFIDTCAGFSNRVEGLV